MKKVILIIVSVIFLALLSSGSFAVYKVWKILSSPVDSSSSEELDWGYKYKAEDFFKDPKVIEFCKSIKKGDFQKADELLKEGVDMNTVGENEMTLFMWTTKYVIATDRPKDKQAFKFFLERKANPLKIVNLEGKRGGYYQETVLRYVASLKDPWYLKELLESGIIKKEDVDFELPGMFGTKTSTLAAMDNNRFESFKMLLDYGADINWEDKGHRSLLWHGAKNMTWQFAYELLKREVNFNVDTISDKLGIVMSMESLTYMPSVSLNYRGVDYRQRCVGYLEIQGIEDIRPWMPEDEKYVKENEKYQLYINEKYHWNKETKKLDQISNEDKWIKFEESYKYDPGYKKENTGKDIDSYEDTKQQPIDYSFKKSFPDED